MTDDVGSLLKWLLFLTSTYAYIQVSKSTFIDEIKSLTHLFCLFSLEKFMKFPSHTVVQKKLLYQVRGLDSSAWEPQIHWDEPLFKKHRCIKSETKTTLQSYWLPVNRLHLGLFGHYSHGMMITHPVSKFRLQNPDGFAAHVFLSEPFDSWTFEWFLITQNEPLWNMEYSP